MNSKKRMLAELRGEATDVLPVAPHWWGNYKYEIAGRDYMLDRWTDGASMVPVYRAFYDRFQPDWFHLSGGYPRQRGAFPSRDYQGVREGGRMVLVAPDGRGDEILPDETLASEQARRQALRDLSSPAEVRRAIDAALDHGSPLSAQEITAQGYTDHADQIVRAYGEEAFICVNVGAPGLLAFGSENYQASLLALYDYPEGAKRLVQQRYAAALEWARAFAAVGVHGWLISEDMAGSDTLAPRMYAEMLYPADCWFFEQVRYLGMSPMVYFCGDVRPLVPLIRDSGVQALLVEESRKTFVLDIVVLARGLAGKVCLFGNLDTTDLLLHGHPAEIEVAVQAQRRAAQVGPFVVGNGSPLAPGTPPQNVEAMIRAARQ
jgi:hypothetical protein